MAENRSLARLSDLEVRLYRLTTRSHLRVGAGEGAADVAVENPLIRALVFRNGQGERIPYIPASSLHGVIRAWVEKALRSGQDPLKGSALQAVVETLEAGDQDEWKAAAREEVSAFLGREPQGDEELYEHFHVYTRPHVCNPLSDLDKCERIAERESQQREWKVRWWRAIGRQLPCAVCSIFGYMGQRGRVKFTHAWPQTEQVPIDVITRVAINRLTGAADEGKLFDLEAIPPGVTFAFFTVLENMDTTQKASFDKGLRALQMQVAGIGAHGTVGFGMVDVERVFTAALKPEVFDQDVEQLIADLVTGEPLDDKTPRFFQALIKAHEKGKETLLDGGIALS